MKNKEYAPDSVDFEFRQVLEDDAMMRTITPMPQIEIHLKRLFGDKLVNDWQTQKENQSGLHRRDI